MNWCGYLRVTARLGLAILTVAGIAACETAVAPRAFSQMTFSHLPPISLDVARIEVVRLYEPPLKAPHVEHETPVPPLTAIERWIGDRLKAAGRDGVARVTIRDARVVETPLKRLGGVQGALTTEQTERYDARVEVMIKATGGRGLRAATAMADAKRSRTVAEDSSIAQRETVWFEMVEKLMRDFDRVFERQIRKHLTAFLK
jgi:hypothetical protein